MKIKSDGFNLDAVLELPDGFDEGSGEKLPILIIIHGFTGNKEEPHLLSVRDAGLRARYAVLRVDMYGHGKSDGRFIDHTLYKWLTNVFSIIDYVEGLDYVSKIYLAGHSQGGCTVMLAAAMLADKLAGILPLSPAWHIPEHARMGRILDIDFDLENIPRELPMWDDFVLGENYLRVAQTLHVEEAIEKYHGPVLIVHGEEDASVPVSRGIDAAQRYDDAKLVIVPEDTHCFDLHADKLGEAVYEWLSVPERER